MARSTAQTVNIFSDTAVTVFGIPNVKDVGFYVSEGNLGDQPGHSSARFCACNNGVGGRGGGRGRRNFLGHQRRKLMHYGLLARTLNES